MFRASSAHLQEDIVVYKQHMEPSLCKYVSGQVLVYNCVLLKMHGQKNIKCQ